MQKAFTAAEAVSNDKNICSSQVRTLGITTSLWLGLPFLYSRAVQAVLNAANCFLLIFLSCNSLLYNSHFRLLLKKIATSRNQPQGVAVIRMLFSESLLTHDPFRVKMEGVVYFSLARKKSIKWFKTLHRAQKL